MLTSIRPLFLTFILLSSLFLSSVMGGTSDVPAQSGLQKGQLINAVFACIGRYYIDFGALKVHEVLRDAMRGVERVVPNLMVSVNTGNAKVRIDGMGEVFEIGGIEYWADLRDLLKEILYFIESSEKCSVSFRELEYAALSSILSGFDPYSKLYQPRDFERAESLGSSSFVGLGMDVEFREGYLAIIQIYEDSSAHRAGLRVGDRIIEVDSESARMMTLREVLQRLTGPEGTNVTVSVVRDGKILSYTLKRQRVEVKNVRSVLLRGDIGYIKIGNFQDGTFKAVVKALEGLKKAADLNGLVIDFRGNYGGVMEEIIHVGDLFLSSGILTVKVSVGKGYPDFIRARPSGNREEGYPLVVLIDEGSASGAEILAAAFKESGRAIVMGEQSFGKACIQQIFGLKGKYAIKLTTARYFTPHGHYIQFVGLAPDVLLIPIKVDRRNPTLTRRVHYLNEGLIRARIERPIGGEKPFASLVYLQEGLAASRSDPESDYQVQLARRLIEEDVLLGEVVRWDVCSRVLRRVQKEEEKRIVKALGRQGIDWSSGMPEGVPIPTASINLDKEINEVEGGESIDITVTVENSGDGALYRVLGRSSSTNPIFDGLEFPIGMIEPGQVGSYTLKVGIPEDSLDRRDEIVIKFTEDNNYTPEYLVAWITVWAQPIPIFAYSYQVLDGVGGRGNGLVETGEHIELALSLRNIGEGNSKDTVVVLRALHPEGVTIHDSRLKIGMLGAKEEKTVKFGLTVGDTPLDRLELEVIIADLNLGVNLLSKLSLPVERGHIDVEDYSGTLEVPRDGVKVYGGRSRTAPVLASLIADSVIRVDGRVPDWFRVPLTGGLAGWVEMQDFRDEVHYKDGRMEDEKEIIPISFLPYRPPIVTLREGVLTAREGSVSLKFHVEDDQDVRGVYVMVNDTKVFYKYNKGRTSECDLTAKLPITRGLNLVRVVAYDDQGLFTEKPFVITGI
ncbi:MAG: S41 family peptidase [Candidatus Brocadiales bacterium]